MASIPLTDYKQQFKEELNKHTNKPKREIIQSTYEYRFQLEYNFGSKGVDLYLSWLDELLPDPMMEDVLPQIYSSTSSP